MSTGWFLTAVIVTVFVTSLSDWFFMGYLFHDKYLTYPEVWRHSGGGKGERLAIAWSTLLGVLTCVVFPWLCLNLGALTLDRTLGLAVGVWLIAPLPMTISTAIWIKQHPLNVFASAAGWLVKLLVCGVCARVFLG